MFWCYIYSDIIKADLNKILHVPGLFSPNENLYLSVHYFPWRYINHYNNGAKGELQMERDHKWEAEGIAAVGQTLQRNSHAKC